MTSKASVRAAIQASRASMTEKYRVAQRTAIRGRVMTQCTELGLAAGAAIAAYRPLRTEPGSLELLEELHRAGYRVLVPITLADRDLDWSYWTPAVSSEPPALRVDALGVDALRSAALVLVPAFAVDRAGHRLGRGGGSYDRALARVAPGTPVAALLYDRELLDDVPVDAWDRPVTAAVQPSGWTIVGAG